jgi:hypothetical protein
VRGKGIGVKRSDESYELSLPQKNAHTHTLSYAVSVSLQQFINP